MSKRFTDTGKWEHPWFHGLPPKLKMAWQFICDRCDGAGVWRVNMPLLSFSIGETITREEFAKAMDSKVVWLNYEKLWIPSFVSFQYKTLSPKNKAHVGIMLRTIEMCQNLPLEGEALSLVESFKSTLNRPSTDPQPALTEGQPTLQEEEKEEEKEKKEGGAGETETPIEIPLEMCTHKFKTLCRRRDLKRESLEYWLEWAQKKKVGVGWLVERIEMLDVEVTDRDDMEKKFIIRLRQFLETQLLKAQGSSPPPIVSTRPPPGSAGLAQIRANEVEFDAKKPDLKRVREMVQSVTRSAGK